MSDRIKKLKKEDRRLPKSSAVPTDGPRRLSVGIIGVRKVRRSSGNSLKSNKSSAGSSSLRKNPFADLVPTTSRTSTRGNSIVGVTKPTQLSTKVSRESRRASVVSAKQSELKHEKDTSKRPILANKSIQVPIETPSPKSLREERTLREKAKHISPKAYTSPCENTADQNPRSASATVQSKSDPISRAGVSLEEGFVRADDEDSLGIMAQDNIDRFLNSLGRELTNDELEHSQSGPMPSAGDPSDSSLAGSQPLVSDADLAIVAGKSQTTKYIRSPAQSSSATWQTTSTEQDNQGHDLKVARIVSATSAEKRKTVVQPLKVLKSPEMSSTTNVLSGHPTTSFQNAPKSVPNEKDMFQGVNAAWLVEMYSQYMASQGAQCALAPEPFPFQDPDTRSHSTDVGTSKNGTIHQALPTPPATADPEEQYFLPSTSPNELNEVHEADHDPDSTDRKLSSFDLEIEQWSREHVAHEMDCYDLTTSAEHPTGTADHNSKASSMSGKRSPAREPPSPPIVDAQLSSVSSKSSRAHTPVLSRSPEAEELTQSRVSMREAHGDSPVELDMIDSPRAENREKFLAANNVSFFNPFDGATKPVLRTTSKVVNHAGPSSKNLPRADPSAPQATVPKSAPVSTVLVSRSQRTGASPHIGSAKIKTSNISTLLDAINSLDNLEQNYNVRGTGAEDDENEPDSDEDFLAYPAPPKRKKNTAKQVKMLGIDSAADDAIIEREKKTRRNGTEQQDSSEDELLPKARKRPAVLSLAKASKLLGMTDNVKNYTIKERSKPDDNEAKKLGPLKNHRLSLTKSHISDKSSKASKTSKPSPKVLSFAMPSVNSSSNRTPPLSANLAKVARLSGNNQTKDYRPDAPQDIALADFYGNVTLTPSPRARRVSKHSYENDTGLTPAIEKVGGRGYFDLARHESELRKTNNTGIIPIKVDISPQIITTRQAISEEPALTPVSSPLKSSFADYQLKQDNPRNHLIRQVSLGPDPLSVTDQAGAVGCPEINHESRKPSSVYSAGAIAALALQQSDQLATANAEQSGGVLRNPSESIFETSEKATLAGLPTIAQSPNTDSDLRKMSDDEADADDDKRRNSISEPSPEAPVTGLDTDASSLSAAVDQIMLSDKPMKTRPLSVRKTILDRINETAPSRNSSPTISEASADSTVRTAVPLTFYAPKTSESQMMDPFRNLGLFTSPARVGSPKGVQNSLHIVVPPNAIESPLKSPIRNPLQNPLVYTRTERGSIYSISQQALAERQYVAESASSTAQSDAVSGQPVTRPLLTRPLSAQVPRSAIKAPSKARPASMMNTTEVQDHFDIRSALARSDGYGSDDDESASASRLKMEEIREEEGQSSLTASTNQAFSKWFN